MPSNAYDGNLIQKFEELFRDRDTVVIPLAMLYRAAEVSEDDTYGAIEAVRSGGIPVHNYEFKVLRCEDVQDKYYITTSDMESHTVRKEARTWEIPHVAMHVEFSNVSDEPAPAESARDTYMGIRGMMLDRIAYAIHRNAKRQNRKFVIIPDRVWVTVRDIQTSPLRYELRIRVPSGSWE